MNQPVSTELLDTIRTWAQELGFQQLGVTDIDLGAHPTYLRQWLRAGYHGSMDYMARNADKRSQPEALVPGTCRIISVRMDYLSDARAENVLASTDRAFISRYALGRDYHKLLRRRLALLAKRIETEAGAGHYRAFVDSAPVLERAVAERAGLGWIAKNTMLINSDAGSWFFLGEIYTDLPLPQTPPQTTKHCGTCVHCLDICPTRAFVAPFQLDARRCISYLTIEHRGSIDPQLRPLLGNRVFGCDDCQLVCPWNKFARPASEDDFRPRHGLEDARLVDLFLWEETDFLRHTEGSAIRRIGYPCWLRNLAVALGNGPATSQAVAALRSRLEFPSELVREHVRWALGQLGAGP